MRGALSLCAGLLGVTAAAGADLPVAPDRLQHTSLLFDGLSVAVGGGYGFGERVFIGDEPATPSGPSAVVSLGYNHQSGNLVFGLEASGSYGRERAAGIFVSTFMPPTTPWSYNVDAAAHLSLRIGWAVGPTMTFAKAGIGGTHIETLVPSVSCEFICTLTSINRSAWHPSALVGVGIERNFGSFFGRLTGELQIVDVSGANYWLSRGTVMAGYRF